MARTSEEIQRGKGTIYEAAFSHEGVFVKVDILHKGPEGWEIYEVKFTSEVKIVHFDDAAIQYYVLTGTGLPVSTVYHWQFHGSYSLKAVLPALVPELSYDKLEISDGQMAPSAWVRMVQSNDDGEKATIRQQLLHYCHLDTCAMVRILQEMNKLAGM